MTDNEEKIKKFKDLLLKFKRKYKTTPSPELKQKILKLKKYLSHKTSHKIKLNVSSLPPTTSQNSFNMQPNFSLETTCNMIDKNKELLPSSSPKALQTPNKIDENSSLEMTVKFSDLPLSSPVLKALNKMNLNLMTPIQQKTIPLGLDNKDILASAKTGSGKTLAFLVPLVEKMLGSNPQKSDGVQAIIISPTKELTVQTNGILRNLCEFTNLRIGLVTSGGSRTGEYDREVRGASILVSTAGRLLDHVRNSPGFSLAGVRLLVIDEADMLLEQGNGDDVRKILSFMPPAHRRQTLLYSATASAKTRQLAGTALRSAPQHTRCVAVDEVAPEATVDSLRQGFIMCPVERRFCCLYAFLARNRKSKIMVFMTARMEVKFYSNVLHQVGFPVSAIYGTMSQLQRRQAMSRFTEAGAGVLLCTAIASRGLDIPQEVTPAKQGGVHPPVYGSSFPHSASNMDRPLHSTTFEHIFQVDWIMQYDPPDDPKEYIHRVGRTARAGARGNALLLLRPHELGFLAVLKEAKVQVTELEFNFDLVGDCQSILTDLVRSQPSLRTTGEAAFSALLRGYAASSSTTTSQNQRNMTLDDLDLPALARSFGLDSVPKVHLPGDREESWARLVSAARGRGGRRRGGGGRGNRKRKI